MRWILSISISIAAAACALDPNDPATCPTLDHRFGDAIARGGGSCVTSADCDVLGGEVEWGCDGSPSIGRCEGTPIAKNAPGYDDARDAAAEFRKDCSHSDFHRTFDCAPIVEATCSNGHCVGQPSGSCFPQPDAGVPDAQ